MTLRDVTKAECVFHSISLSDAVRHNIVDDYPSPAIVATIFLAPPNLRNSQRYIPCHVPRLSLPAVIGIVTEFPMIEAFAWAGMSSGPSIVCV